MGLKAFLTGFKEPLGCTIRAMRPETRTIALSNWVKEQNIFYHGNEPNNKFRINTNNNIKPNPYKPPNFPQPNVFKYPFLSLKDDNRLH